MAETEYCIADVDRMEEHCKAVLAQVNSPLEDKFRAYLVMVESPASRNNITQALELSLSILSNLGCTFPKSNAMRGAHALSGLLNFKRKLSKNIISAERISNLPPVKDPTCIFAMHLLEKMDPYCYISGNLNLYILVALRRIAWTLEYGYCEHSPSAFSAIGIVYTGAMGEILLGKECAKHCISLQDQVGSRAIISTNTLRCYGLNLHFTTPLQTCMKFLLSGYQIGLQMGDVSSAMWCVYHYLDIAQSSGKPLVVLDADYPVYTKQMKESRQWQVHGCCLAEHQAVQNLMGRSANPVVLTGHVMNQTEALTNAEDSRNFSQRSSIRRKQMSLACIFGEHKMGAALALKFGEEVDKDLAGTNGTISYCLHCAISCLSAFQETKQRKYKAHAKKLSSRIKAWVKGGNPNIPHLDILLDAELLAVQCGGASRSKEATAMKLFESANITAGRLGCIQDRALINERYGEFLYRLGDEKHADFRIEEALKLYREWCAEGKVAHLMGKYQKLKKT